MPVKEIITVLVIASFFILLSVLTKRIRPTGQTKEEPKFMRIFFITVGVLFLALIWFLAPLDRSILWKILLSLFAVNSIYRGLAGWLFKAAKGQSRK